MKLKTVLFALLFFSFVSVTKAAVFVVNDSIDNVDANPGDGLCESAIGKCNLRAAVMEANALAGLDRVIFDPIVVDSHDLTITGSGGTEVGDLDVTEDIIVNANGQTILGSSLNDRVFGIYPGVAFTLQSATISSAGDVSIVDGGAISASSANVTIRNSSFINNQALDGGALYLYNSVTTIINSSFENNNSGLFAGALRIHFGRATITNSEFIGNTTFYQGGAIYSSENDEIIIRQSHFEQNQGETGGAIYSNLSNQVEIYDSTYIQNAADDAGAVYLSDNTQNIIKKTTFSENQSKVLAGALYMSNSTSQLVANTFDNNSGAINGGAIYVLNEAAEIVNSTIHKNHASDEGAGIYIADAASLLEISNVTISENKTGGVGGGIRSFGENIDLRNSIIANNIASSSTGPDCYGLLDSNGYNIVGIADDCDIVATGGDIFGSALSPVDPLLDVLANYGGSTLTQLLLPGSPAIDAGQPTGCTSDGTTLLIHDQTGADRHLGIACDIGAYESKL